MQLNGDKTWGGESGPALDQRGGVCVISHHFTVYTDNPLRRHFHKDAHRWRSRVFCQKTEEGKKKHGQSVKSMARALTA